MRPNSQGRVIALGGGTGLPALLESLKPPHGGDAPFGSVSAVVTVMDDGGSSGRLRRDLGTLSPGDIRNCLIALSDAPETMRRIFQYRFESGELEGHSLGNLFIAALADLSGDFASAVSQLHEFLAIRGRIYPSTQDNVRLVAELEDGSEVIGEAAIPRSARSIRRLRLDPQDCHALPEACDALARADLILLGPGSLYTSVLPNLLVRDLADAIRASRARKVYCCNLVTQPGETAGFTASRHAAILLEHCGEGLFDTVLCNREPLPPAMERAYERTEAAPVEVDALALRRMGLCIIEADLLAEGNQARHDPAKLRKALADLARSAVEVA